jgi:N6-adenosine-specific RNA methylase IME4
LTNALALPDPNREPVPVGWSEALLERLPEIADVPTLDSGRITLAGYVAEYRAKGADTRELRAGERYVEVRMGEVLGPAGPVGRPPGKRSDKSISLDSGRAAEFRALAAWRDKVIAQVRAGVLGRPALLAKVAAWEAAKNMADDDGEPVEDVSTFSVIYADPPWQYEHNQTPLARAIENHYTTMTTEAICGLIEHVQAADDAVLFLWATNPKLPEALRVMTAWGFTYRTNMVWVKDRPGMGYFVRGQHELLLIGGRGSLPVPAPSDRPSSVVEAPRQDHSAKPAEVYELIEAMYPAHAWRELFARQRRPGWSSWGHGVAP